MSKSSLELVIKDGERLLLDTTVLAGFLDAGEATHPITAHILNDLVASGRNPAVVSMVTVMEILVRPMKMTPPGHRTVLAFLRSHPNLDCVPIDLQVAQDAAHLRADKGMKPPDALIVATGLANQVRHVVTNDHNWSTKLVKMQAHLNVVQLSSHLPFP
jgi:predicted nucleic acid-binding protein